MTRRVLLSWSSGKEAAWTLQVLRDDPRVEVVGLPTTVNTTHERVAMHAAVGSVPEDRLGGPSACLGQAVSRGSRRA